MKKILITGVAGFVGTNLASHLLKNGYDVVGVDLYDRHDRLSDSGLLKNNNFTFENIDLAREKLAESLGDGVATIFHLAALPHVDYSYFHPQRTISNNIEALTNVLNLAKNTNTPMILASSVEVYGGSEKRIYKETDTLNPLSPYAASKVASEAIVKAYIETQKVSASIFRFTNLYGRWQAPDRLLPRIISQILTNGNVIIEKGTNRDFLYIDDACHLLEQAIDLKHVGDILNLSTGISRDNFDVIQKVLKHLPHDNVQLIEPRKNDGRGKYLVASSEKLFRLTQWSAQTSLDDGIDHTIKWYKSHTEWLSQFTDNITADRKTHDFLIDSSLTLGYWRD